MEQTVDLGHGVSFVEESFLLLVSFFQHSWDIVGVGHQMVGGEALRKVDRRWWHWLESLYGEGIGHGRRRFRRSRHV